MSEDLKKIREALNHNVGHSRLHLDNESFESAKEALRLFDAHVAALSQQEAEEIAVCCGRRECGGECGNEWQGMMTPKPASLPQPVESSQCDHVMATNTIKWDDGTETGGPFCIKCGEVESVPQDAEEWISENAINTGMVHGYAVPIYKLRTFLSQRDAGSVRVPVELDEDSLDALCKRTLLGRSDVQAVWTETLRVLTASKEGV